MALLTCLSKSAECVEPCRYQHCKATLSGIHLALSPAQQAQLARYYSTVECELLSADTHSS